MDELRNQYHWLLFFSVPKLLLLYHLLREKKPNVEAIVHEISFLCSNEQAAWKSTHDLVELSVQLVRSERWIDWEKLEKGEKGEGKGGREGRGGEVR